MSDSHHRPANNLAAGFERNKNQLREVQRTIVAAYILSKDDFMLLGKQDPSKGGTYPTAWRAPGGGVNPRETLFDAMLREASQEVIGLDLTKHPLRQLPITAKGEAEKTLDNGEVVWQKMDFYHFEVVLGKTAAELTFLPGDDLVELHWFSREERAVIELIPGGRELMIEAGHIDLAATL